jgi:hypothetical protein
MPSEFQLGLDTFGDVTVNPDGSMHRRRRRCAMWSSRRCSPSRSAWIVLAWGEHHRADFAVSAPEVVLAAIAAKTSRLILGSAVTVLSTDDPVRVFQRFSTLNAISNGRAEVILGRGSFTESYALFGYELSQYNELFESKLARFAQLLTNTPVIYPRLSQAPCGRGWAWVEVPSRSCVPRSTGCR